MKDVRSKYHTEGSLSMKKNENKYTPYVKDGSGVANQIVAAAVIRVTANPNMFFCNLRLKFSAKKVC